MVCIAISSVSVLLDLALQALWSPKYFEVRSRKLSATACSFWLQVRPQVSTLSAQVLSTSLWTFTTQTSQLFKVRYSSLNIDHHYLNLHGHCWPPRGSRHDRMTAPLTWPQPTNTTWQTRRVERPSSVYPQLPPRDVF